MEARVDIKKLQLLNDRIVQTIDALNQVRLTVHGLSHTPTSIGALGTSGTLGQPAGFAVQAMSAPYAQSYPGFGAVPFGLSHTGVNPQQTAFGAPFSPIGLALGGNVGSAGNVGASVANWPVMGSTGLSHSTIEEQWIAEMRAQDPRRLSQTFPYCYVP
jgi:hypothetical protein